MMVRLVSTVEVLDALQTAVLLRGADYVHEGPKVYFYPDGNPCCLVGQVLYLLDLPRPQYGDDVNDGGVVRLVEDWLIERDVVLEGNAVTALTLAQEHQDDFVPWGEAVEKVVAKIMSA